MEMHNRDKYDGRMSALAAEEAELESYLLQNSNSLSGDELKALQNKLTGIRNEKQEIDQIITGAFY